MGNFEICNAEPNPLDCVVDRLNALKVDVNKPKPPVVQLANLEKQQQPVDAQQLIAQVIGNPDWKSKIPHLSQPAKMEIWNLTDLTQRWLNKAQEARSKGEKDETEIWMARNNAQKIARIINSV